MEYQAASPIGADAILEEVQQEGREAHEGEDSDALARTAGQLLDSVRESLGVVDPHQMVGAVEVYEACAIDAAGEVPSEFVHDELVV